MRDLKPGPQMRSLMLSKWSHPGSRKDFISEQKLDLGHSSEHARSKPVGHQGLWISSTSNQVLRDGNSPILREKKRAAEKSSKTHLPGLIQRQLIPSPERWGLLLLLRPLSHSPYIAGCLCLPLLLWLVFLLPLSYHIGREKALRKATEN